LLSISSVPPLQMAKASTLFKEVFDDPTLPQEWWVYSMHGGYSIANGHLNLRSTDYTPWA
jgi:hypothetical protein